MSRNKQEIRFVFECENCGLQIEKYLTIDAKKPKRCSGCGKNKLFQHFATTIISYVGVPKTAGQQAERNAKRLGKDMIEQIENSDPVCKARKEQKKAKLPWYRDGSIEGTERMEKPLDIKKIKDVKKYIETGEKN